MTDTPNPTITAYLGETIDFYVDAQNQPFWIKQKQVMGQGEVDPIWANVMENNGTDNGRLRVRFNQPGDYYYISEVDKRLSGKIVVLPIAKRQPDTPNQIYIVTTGLPIARASDATLLVPADSDLTDIAGGHSVISTAPALVYQTTDAFKYGAGCVKFDTPGLESNCALTVTGNHTDSVIVPFDDSFTFEAWISFSTFNEDDPNWDPNSEDYIGQEPYVRILEIQGTQFRVAANCPGPDPCYHLPSVLTIDYYSDILGGVESTALPRFLVKYWTNAAFQEEVSPPAVEYEFQLPRFDVAGELEDVIQPGLFNHFAFTRDAGEQALSIYVNGQRYGQFFDSSIAESMDLLDGSYRIGFGGNASAGSGEQDSTGLTFADRIGDNTLNGFMDDIRILRGVRYRGANYDVPTEAHPLTP